MNNSRVGTAFALLAIAGCFGKRARPDVEQLVSYYAPGVRIGDRVSDSARAKYALRVAPYFGYRDTTYRGPDGVRALGLGVNEYIDDGDPKVSPRARVTEVEFELPDTQVVTIVIRRLRATLGTPTEQCHRIPGMVGEPAKRMHRLKWTGPGEGVVLSHATWLPADTSSAGADSSARVVPRPSGFAFGWVSFAVEPSIAGTGLEVIPCASSAQLPSGVIPTFEVDLSPGEGNPVIHAVGRRLDLRSVPSLDATVIDTLIGAADLPITYDSTRYQTITPAPVRVLAAASIRGRSLGRLRHMSLNQYYSASFPHTVVSVSPSTQIAYLQYRAEGTCFVRVDTIVIDADPCPAYDTISFRRSSEPVTDWWVHVAMPRAKGWLRLTDSTARVVDRAF